MSNPEIEEEVILVCNPADEDGGRFADNVVTGCECGRKIVLRPYNDRPEYRKLCFPCAARLAHEAHANGDEIEHGVTPEGMAEINEYMSQADYEKAMKLAKELLEGGGHEG